MKIYLLTIACIVTGLHLLGVSFATMLGVFILAIGHAALATYRIRTRHHASQTSLLALIAREAITQRAAAIRAAPLSQPSRAKLARHTLPKTINETQPKPKQ